MNRMYRIGLTSSGEIQKAVNELLDIMTLEEKAGQLCQSVGADIVAIGSTKVTEKVDDLIRDGRIGSMIQVEEPLKMVEKIRRFQDIAVHESRLGIPLLFCQDVIHGFETVAPIPLAWACSFDMDGIRKAVTISAKEAASCGIGMAFSPMVDIVRDPRWGRVAESAGEDPFLGSEIAKAQVQGFSDGGLLCCLKHYVGYGAAEAGRDYNTVEISDSTLYNIYLPPFRAGIEAGAGSVMTAFNVMDGLPMACHQKLINTVLRKQLGFDGIVISDYSALMELMNHGVAENEREAALKAFNATLDIEMTTSYYARYLPELVRTGVVTSEALDAAVARVLTAKYKLGLMEDPYVFCDDEKARTYVFCEENRSISGALAAESAVLLKNTGVLPLSKESKIALVGPFAESRDLLGCWQFSHRRGETINLKEGLAAEGFAITTEAGCEIFDEIQNGFDNARKAVSQADVVVLALGESSIISGEACSRQNIELPEVQKRLAEAVLSIGKPVVLVVFSGRPLILTWYADKVDAILQSWFLGAETGSVLAGLLSGRLNPSGHLSMSFPYALGQVPVYYNALPTGRPYIPESGEHFQSKYLDGPNAPLYAFGYGLSYTSFELTDFTMSARGSIGTDIPVQAVVTNTGTRCGTTVLQLYIQDLSASLSRPARELKGFRRITLEPGESKTVDFILNDSLLGFYLGDGSFIVENGKFIVSVGFSSLDEDLSMKEFVLEAR